MWIAYEVEMESARRLYCVHLVGTVWKDSQGNECTAQIYGAGLGVCGMSRGGTIPIAAGGIPLKRRHDRLVE